MNLQHAERDLNQGSLNQSVNNSRIQLPVDKDVGLEIGRKLAEKIGIETVKDLIVKILLPSILSFAVGFGSNAINLSWIFTALFLALGGVLLLSFLAAFTYKCDNCGKFFGKNIQKRDLVGTRKLRNVDIHNVEVFTKCKYCGNESAKIVPIEENHEDKTRAY